MVGRTSLLAGVIGCVNLFFCNPLQAQGNAPAVDPDSPPWIVQSAGDPDTFGLHDEITVELTFDQLVRVSGNPRITLDIGGATRYATFSAADPSLFRQQVLFKYVVQAGDEDSDGLDVIADSLELNGGTIEGSGGVAAVLDHPSQPSTDIRRPVDGVAPTVTFTSSGSPFYSPEGLVPVVVRFSEPVTGVTLDDFVVTNGTAEDLEEDTLVEPSGSTYSFQVEPDGEGAVTVTLAANAAHDDAGNGNAASPQFRALVGDPATVTITPNTVTTTEGDPVEFELLRSQDNGERTVQVEVSQVGDYLTGDTSFGATFSSTPATVSVTFAAGDTTKTLSLDTEDDYLVEADGTVTLTVLADPTEVGYLRGTPNTATATVQSTDTELSVTVDAQAVDPESDQPASSTQVREGGTIQFTLVRSHDVGEHTLDVEIVQSGDFLADSHPGGLTLPADGRVPITFEAGELSASISVSTDDDAVQEADGIVRLTVRPRPGDPLNPIAGEPKVVVVWDDDDPPTVTVSADAASVMEGELITYTLTRTEGSTLYDGAMLAEVEVTQDGAVLENPGPLTWTLVFNEGDAISVYSWRAVDDEVPEADGALTLRVLPPAQSDAGRYLVGTPVSATTKVVDNDLPAVSVSALTDPVTEGTAAEFRFSRVGSTADSLSVGVNILGHKKIMSDATRALVEQTEAPADTVVTFDSGQSEATLTLTTEADQVNEGDGEVRVVIASSAAYQIGSTGSATVLVRDDDIPEVTLRWVTPTLTLQNDTWVGEILEGGEIWYELDCSGNTLAPAAVYGENFRTRIVTRKQEILNHPASYDRDNEWRLPCSDQPAPGFTAHAYGAGTRYTGPQQGEIRVDVLPQKLKPPHGRQCYLDSADGGTEDVRFCPQYTLGGVTSARLTVTNRNPTITVEALEDSVNEGETARFKLTRLWNDENLQGYTTTFDFKTVAEGGYVSAALPGGSRTFQLGEAEIIIEVPTENDLLPNDDGSVTLELLPGLPETQAQNIGGTYAIYDQIPGTTPAGKNSRVATVQIVNDDDFPALLIPDASVEEGYPVEFTATLSGAHDQAITVDWSVVDGTAVVGEDYSPHTAGGTLSFAVGETEKTISVTTLEDLVPEEDETFSLALSNPVQVALPAQAPVGTILNDDLLPVVTVAPLETPVDEGNSPWFVVTRQGFTEHVLDVQLSFTKDGAALLERPLRIPIGEESRTIRVRHVDTDEPAVTEFVYVATIGASADYVIGTPGSATVNVLNDDARREFEVRVDPTPTTFNEAGETITFSYLISNSGNIASGAPVTIYSDLFGEFVASEESIPPVQEPDDTITVTRDYTVTASDVTDGSITETFYAGDGYIRSGTRSYTVSLGDREFKYQLFTQSDVEGVPEEDVGELEITILRLDESTQSHTVRYYTENGTAKAGEDYTAVTGTVTFDEGKTEGDIPKHEVFIPVTDDGLDEPYEDLNFVLVDDETPTQVYARTRDGFEDNDPPVFPVFTNNHETTPNPKTNESWPGIHGDLYVTAQLHRELEGGATEQTMSGKTVEFTYQTVDGTARAGEDYTEVSGRVILSPGSNQWRFPITIIDDSIFEGATPETFSIELSDGVNIDLSGDRDTYTIEIEDDDAASDQFMLAVSPTSVDEDAGATAVTVTAALNEAAFTEDTEVTISLVDGTATAGADFEAVSDFTLTIPANQLSGTATFTLTPIDDGAIETYRELFRVTGTATDLTSTPTNGVTMQILDDDAMGVTIDPTALTFDEGQTGTYTVVLTSVPTGTVTVTPSLPAGAPASVSPATLSFTATDWNMPKTVTVSATADDDADDEEAEIGHSVSGADYATVSADAVTVTIVDDETPSTAIALQASPASIAEEDGDQTITVTASLDEAPLAEDITVEVDVGGDTAAQGSDFTAVASFEVTIAAGDTGGSGTFTLSPVNDDVDEDEEALSITGQVVANGAPVQGALPVNAATVTIVDDDTRGVVVSPTALTVDEKGGQGSYTVVMTSEPSQEATLEVNVPADADLKVSPTQLFFDRDNWSEEQTVRIAATADADVADDEATLSHTVTGGDYGGIAVDDVTVTIAEPTSATMTVADARGSEGSGALEFDVTLGEAIKAEATVQYRTVGMTATNGVTAESGKDYTHVSGTLTFAAGDTEKTVRVTLLNDALNEAEEYFELVLENPVNAELPQPTPLTKTVKGVITDDDPLPVVSVVGTAADGWSYGDEATDDLSYTIRLSAASSREVRVDYATSDSAPEGSNQVTATAAVDYAPISGKLTFAVGETEKTLTVTVNDDAVSEGDEVFALQLSNPTNAMLSNQGWGVIQDEDVRGVVLTPGALTIGEGKAKTYTVALSSQPTAAVTVALTATTGVLADPTSLSFLQADWSTAQTVTVTTLQDDDAVDDSAAITHSFSGGDYAGEPAAQLAVTVRDDDQRGIELSPKSLAFDEGGKANYTVVLKSKPSDDVTVTIGGTGGTNLDLSTNSLRFTTSTWNIENAVTVTDGGDPDTANDLTTLTHIASGGDYSEATRSLPVTASLPVTVRDDDTPGLVLSETSLAVAEGGSASYTVELATQPARDVTVTIEGTANTDLTLNPTSLTFTSRKWNTAQTVSVSAGEDDDAELDTTTLSHSASGADYGSVIKLLPVSVSENDTRGVTVKETSLSVTEGGTATYTVVLDSQPTATVTVTPSRASGSSPDVTFSPASLSFTTGNWNQAKTVTVSAAEDDDAEDDEATLEHGVSGGDYASETAGSVAVTVTDNETASETVTLTVSPASVDEDDAATTVTVTGTLDGAPLTSDVSVTVEVGVSGDAATEGTDYTAVADFTLTIDAGDATGTATFTLTPTDDDLDEADETLSVRGRTTAAGLTVVGTTVTIVDDDTRGVTVSTPTLSVTEGGTATYTVVLDSQPTATVTVTPSRASGSSTDVTFSPASLSFTTGNWKQAKTVTVSAAEDADAEDDEATLAHGVSGGDYASVTAGSVAVTVTDDETESDGVVLGVKRIVTGGEGVTLDDSGLAVAEDADPVTVTLTATLDGAPLTADKSVTISVGTSGDAATEGTDYSTVADFTLTIVAGETEGTATFTLTPNDDDLDEADETLTVWGTDSARALTVRAMTVLIRDDDTRGVTVSAPTLSVTEGGTATYTVVLDSQPTATVTVTPSRASGSSPDVTFSPASLSFTTGNWKQAKTVTVSAAEDDDAEDDEATLAHGVSGGDYGANSVTADDVDVTVTDDETASETVTLSVSPASVDEDAESTTVTVTGTLDEAPFTTGTSVTVAVGDSGDAATEGTDYTTIADFTLTIAAGQTSGTATFTLTPTDDDLDEADETLSVRGTTTAAGLTVAVTTATIVDDDTRGVTVSTPTLSVTEGGTVTYTVVLDSQPTATVTVTPSRASGSSTDVTFSPASLSFTTGNWKQAKTVTVSAAGDDDAEDDEATLEHGVSGGDYASETAGSVAVTVTDDETASETVTLSVSPASVDEEDAATTVTVTGTLDGAPLTSDASVTVEVGASGDAATEGTDYATVADFTLTIAAGQTSGTADFTLTPTDDDLDEADETLSVRGTTTAAGLTVAETTATIVDNDTRGVTVSTPTLSVTEGGTATYTIVLESQPTATVTVTPSRASRSSTDVTFSPASLSFTTGNWKQAKTVTVSAAEDDDAEDDEATLEHGVSGGDYGANSVTAADVDVTVTDNEAASETVTLSVSPASVDEEDAATTVTVTGTLDGAPLTSDASVTVEVGASGDAATEGTDYATVADFTLTIDAGDATGTATFSLAPTDDDLDEADETLSVRGTTTAAGLTVAVTTATIVDDDTRGVTVSTPTLSVTEGGSATYTVVLDSQPTATVTVTPSRASGSSTDVTFSPASLSFTTGNWNQAKTVTVSAAGDDDAEDDEATLEHGVSGGDYASETAGSVAVTVTDDETASETVTLSVSPASVDEEDAATTVTVTGTLDGAPLTSDASVTVEVGASGDAATEGTDYATVADFTLTIAAGQTSGTADFTLTPTDDDLDEADETLSVRRTTTAAGLTVAGTTATIVDDDTRGVTVSTPTLSVTEGGTATYTIVLESQPTATVTVTPSVTGSTDVTFSPASLSFTTGNWNQAKTVTVSAAEDDDAEQDTATLAHAVSGADYDSELASDVAVTVADNETESEAVTLTVSPASVDEDDAATTVTVTGTLDGAARTSEVEVTVLVGAAVDTATEGTDYSTVADFTLTISAGQTTGTATFSLTPTDDDLDEADEVLSVSGTTNVAGMSVSGAIVTIRDDDERGVVVSPGNLTVREKGTATYTVVLESEPTGTVTVTPSVTGSTDVTFSPGTLSFTKENWDQAKTVTVSAAEDSDAEDDQATIAHVVSGADYAAVTAGSVGVTVTDNGTPSERASRKVTLGVDPPSVNEDAGATTVTVTGTLDGPAMTSNLAVTVSVGAAGDAATEGTDYSTVADFILTISAGKTTGTATFSLTPTDDHLDEVDEAVSVSGTTDVTGMSVSGTSVMIMDDDETVPERVTLGVDPPSVDEDAGATTVTVTGTLDGPAMTSNLAVTVSVGAAGDAATEGTDYSTVADFILTISAGKTTGTATFSLTPTDDHLDEVDEAVSVSGTTDVTGMSVSGTSVMIMDDDETVPERVTLGVDPPSVNEDAGATTVTVTGTLDGPAMTSNLAVTVSVGAAGDAATEGTDYSTVADFILTISAGKTTGTATFSLTPTDDHLDEVDEAVSVSGTTDVTGMSVSGTSVMIMDDDETVPERVTLGVDPPSVNEDAGATTVTVTGTLDGPAMTSNLAVTVSVGAAGDAATEGTDYSTVADFILTISAGKTTGTATFSLTPTDDHLDEVDEAVSVSGTTDVTGMSVSGTSVMIMDDDETVPERVTLGVDPPSVNEDAGATTVTVTGTLDGPAMTSNLAVTVSVGAAGDAATEGTDYSTVADFTLTISAGKTTGTATFSLTPTDDHLDEVDEAVSVSGTTDVTGMSVSGTSVMIMDDDETVPERVTLGVDPPSVNEDAGATTVTVTGTLDGPAMTSNLAVTVSVGAAGDAATEGTDYSTVADFTLTISAGKTTGTATFSLTPTDDHLDEVDEAVSVSGTTDVTGMSVSGTSVMIMDDDDRGVAVNPKTLTIGEKGRATYTVVLTSRPTGTVTVTPRVSGMADVMVSPTSLSFTTENWDTPQTVTVTASAGAMEEVVEVEHDVAGADYDSEMADDVQVTVRASQTVTLSLDKTALDEGAESTTLTVTGALDGAPRTSDTSVTVTVGASEDTATEGTDYASVGDFTLTISAGEGEGAATFTLAPLDDREVEEDESLTVTGTTTAEGLSVESTSVTITDNDEFIGDSELIAEVWLARFGRTAAHQVFKAVEGRIGTSRKPGKELRLRRWGAGGMPSQAGEPVGNTQPRAPLTWQQTDFPGEYQHQQGSGVALRKPTLADIAAGSSFAWTRGSQESGFGALWGHGATSRFNGSEGDMRLDGQVHSGMVGADWMRGRGVGGFVVSHSRGDGGFNSEDREGELEASVTGIYPWGSFAISDRLTLTGLAGYGKGALKLLPEGALSIETDTSLAMAGVDLRGVLLESSGGPVPELAASSEVLGVRTTSDAARGGQGDSVAAEVNVTRVGLEGRWVGLKTGGGIFVPRLEMGVRRDGGDAETGFGADIGAGLDWAKPDLGIEAQFRVRGLLTHQEDGFEEFGMSASLIWDPKPRSELGPSFSLSQNTGASATGGMEALLRSDTVGVWGAGSQYGGLLDRRQSEAKLGYGLSLFGGRLVGVPELGLVRSNQGRKVGFGWRLHQTFLEGMDFRLALEGSRLGVQLRARW